jgi:Effector-associated domain 1/vWA-MoxR associated protein C-terminal domain/vWA-MoxR associated protein middle region (VMAP-M) 1
MELTGKQSKQLSEALIDAFPENKDLEMMLLYELEKKLNEISLGDTYKQVIFDVIKYFEAQGKIEDLIKAALQENPNNPKLISFNSDYSDGITENDWNNCKNILDKINFDIVKSAYRATLPVGSLTDNSELNNPSNIDSIISILSNKYPKTSKNIPSILEFSKQIANKLQGQTIEYQNLESWCKQLAARLKITIDIAPESDNEIKSAYCNAYLLVVVYPEGNQFRLESEYIFDTGQKCKSQPLDLQVLLNIPPEDSHDGKGIICDSFEGIAKRLGEILKKFISKFPEETLNLTLEIFLPYKYMGDNIDDKWRIQNDFEEYVPIVTENVYMIIHPLERITGALIYRSFRQGWTRLMETLNTSVSSNCILTQLEKIQSIDSRNYQKISNSLKNKIGLKLTAPLSENSREQEIFWRTILGGGVPIAFWTRCETPEHLSLEEIDCHLTIESLKNDLQKLIEKTCDIRRDAYVEESPSKYLGYHLGVLCDNPNRIPKIERLQEFKMG